MRVAVMGAGAVGCFYGGMLARSGHEVVLVGRPNHVRAIEREGLRLQTSLFDEAIVVSAVTEASGAAGAELVLFCVKSCDTEAAAAALKPHLSGDALIVTLQNGVDNADRVRSVVTQEVCAAVVYVACEMAGPGHVRHHGRGELIVEPGDAAERMARVANAAGIQTELSANVRSALWEKLVLNCAYNAISALVQLPLGELRRLGGAGVETAMRDIVAECIAVARADGVDMPEDVDATVQSILSTIPAGQYSSTAQDLARSRRSEIGHLNGHIVRRGGALGVPTPVNHLLLMLIQVLDNRQNLGT